MTCPCDQSAFPRPLSIAAALPSLPRSLGIFPDWRLSMLAAIGREPPLDGWRARDPEDLGLMLAEMSAYLFDVISFYDALIANESYLRTASLAGSQRKHVSLLGYVPRPAVAAEALLAAQADGRSVLKLPAYTAFRSGEFDGNPPQVFELTTDAAIDPRINRFEIGRVRETVLPASFTSLLVQPRSVRVRTGDPVVLDFNGTLRAARVSNSFGAQLRSKLPATRVGFTTSISPPAGTTYAQSRLLKPGAAAGLWKRGSASGESAVLSGNTILLESLLPIRAGDIVLLEHGTTLLAHRITSVSEEMRIWLPAQTSTITDAASNVTTLVSAPIKGTITRVTLDSTPSWPAGTMVERVVLHYACSEGAVLLPPVKDTLDDDDPLVVPGFIDPPRTPVENLLLEDIHGDGVAAAGTLDVTTHSAALDGGQDWGKELWAPVKLYGNVLRVSRGESVSNELLGMGDGQLPEQTFTLKKKPLTYLNAANAGGMASTLEVRVGGVLWKEASNFYRASVHDQIYVVRHDDAGDTHITFGGGARLPSGALVTADYRFGAGAAVPPSGSIKQLAKPVANLRGVHNVLPAFGGANAESPAELAVYAPRSALLLGRAISLVDLEVAAAQVGGVRAARAAWRWDEKGLRPAAIVSYIGDEQLKPAIIGKLRALAESDAPIAVERSHPQPASLNLSLRIHDNHTEQAVIDAVRESLCGLLRAEALGPDGIVFLSHIVHAVMQVPGVIGIDHVDFDAVAFTEAGRQPAAGKHFDFELGGVWINNGRVL